ncbi:MAG TPA: hypothetical protein VNJ07_00190 [Chitinophagales bacterium]|nr:hypothetical protein [Chitinophagales bacterium]
MKKFITAILISAVLSGCAAMLHAPAEADVATASQHFPGITYESLQKGYHLYVTKCSGCHRLYEPSEHTGEQWRKLLPEMAERAKLNDEEQDLIYKYLMTMTESSAGEKN